MNFEALRQELLNHASKKRELDENSFDLIKEGIEEHIEKTGDDDIETIMTLVVKKVFDEAYRQGVLDSIKILQER